MKFRLTFLWLSAIFFMVYGLVFTLVPTIMSVLVTGSGPDTALALIHARATYGGMSFGAGLLLGILAKDTRTAPQGLLGVAALVGGMAIARGWGIFVDGPVDALVLVFWGIEVALSLFALLAYLLPLRRPTP